jgi:hypothetical protein
MDRRNGLQGFRDMLQIGAVCVWFLDLARRALNVEIEDDRLHCVRRQLGAKGARGDRADDVLDFGETEIKMLKNFFDNLKISRVWWVYQTLSWRNKYFQP